MKRKNKKKSTTQRKIVNVLRIIENLVIGYFYLFVILAIISDAF